MLVKPEFLSIAYGGFRRAVLEWNKGQNSIKQIEEKYKDTEHIINQVTKWINQESNPIIKNIILSEKLSNQTHEVVDKFSNYTKRFCDQIHTIEDQKTEKLSIISDAVNELEKFLDSQSEDDKIE